mgnify:CR=1 FL=1
MSVHPKKKKPSHAEKLIFFSYLVDLSITLKEARENFEKEYLTTQLKKFNGNISNIIQTDEYPNPSSLLLFETFNGSTTVSQPLSSIELTSGKINQIDNQFIQPEDTILTTIKRISSSLSILDDYEGDVGFSAINWTFSV